MAELNPALCQRPQQRLHRTRTHLVILLGSMKLGESRLLFLMGE